MAKVTIHNKDRVNHFSKAMPGENATAVDHAASNDLSGKSDRIRSADSRGQFLCGVVEGFYGRPWTTEQRKDLFTKMQVRTSVVIFFGSTIFFQKPSCRMPNF
jgi:hypothetical protein